MADFMMKFLVIRNTATTVAMLHGGEKYRAKGICAPAPAWRSVEGYCGAPPFSGITVPLLVHLVAALVGCGNAAMAFFSASVSGRTWALQNKRRLFTRTALLFSIGLYPAASQRLNVFASSCGLTLPKPARLNARIVAASFLAD